MKLLTLIALAQKERLSTVQEAMQLAARTTDQFEMEFVRREVRMMQLCDKDGLEEVKQALLDRKPLRNIGQVNFVESY